MYTVFMFTKIKVKIGQFDTLKEAKLTAKGKLNELKDFNTGYCIVYDNIGKEVTTVEQFDD